MKQIKLKPIFQSNYIELENQAHKIKLTNESQSIHDFRVAYKKLRAIIRLSSTEKKIFNQFKEIKKIYQVLGKIRELELVQEKIRSNINIKANFKLSSISELQQKITSLENSLSKIPIEIILENSFKKIKKINLKKCSLKKIKKFIVLNWENAKSSINKIKLADTSIHNIRKKLKDIFYTIRLLESERNKKWISKRISNLQLKNYNQILNELGNFQDSCNALQILNQLKRVKSETIQKLKNDWINEKVKLKKSISEKINADYFMSLKINL
jgi:CHAD domain-containing protein